jgi:predicted DNA-binding protein (MmcQ/YjbR family)
MPQDDLVDRDAMIDYCLAKPGAWRDQPWDDATVAKVGPKIFAFLSRDDAIGVKCGRDRDEADEWLDRFPEDASPMPYLARSGWNSLCLEGAIPDEDLLAAVDESYDRVVSGLPKKHRP